MQKNIIIILALMGVVGMVAQVEGADRRAKTQAETIGAFIDGDTFVVGRVDMGKMDIDAIVAKAIEVFSEFVDDEEAKKAIVGALESLGTKPKQRIDDFVKAGGRDVYAAMGLSTFPYFHLVVPMGAGADKEALMGWFELTRKDFDVGTIGQFESKGALVIGPVETVEYLRGMQSAGPRAELVDALSAAGDATVQLVVIPSADQRRVIEEMLPILPIPSGQSGGADGISIAEITRGIMWAAVGVDGPPKMSLKVTVQCRDQAAAEKVKALIDTLYKMFGQHAEVRKELPDVDTVLAALAPLVVGDRVVISLNDEQANSLIRSISASILSASPQVQSGHNVHQILNGCILYGHLNKGLWPGDLQSLVPKYSPDPKVLVNPRQPQKEVGYTYIRPEVPFGQIKNAERVVVVYEWYDVWPECGGIAVGFADGHVDRIEDEEKFERLLGGGPGK